MDGILIRYGELTLKGKNRPLFLHRLEFHIQILLKKYPSLQLVAFHDHMIVRGDTNELSLLSKHLTKIAGIHSFSPFFLVEKTIEDIFEGVKLCTSSWQQPTFRIECHRGDKSFPLDSREITLQVAKYLDSLGIKRVDLHHPDKTLWVDIRQEGIYIYDEIIEGLKGLPQSEDQRVMVLISGGIDSPVAAVEMLKKGCTLELLHFDSPPYTTPKALQKVLDLAQEMTNFQSSIRLHIIHFTAIQEAIDGLHTPSYNITLMRRFFFLLATKWATTLQCHALVTGESLGQVASQTLESLVTLSSVTSMPIFRPLLTWDKDVIIERSKKLGFYPISVRPYRDCCVVFTPHEPATKPSLRRTLELESGISKTLVAQALEKVETLIFNF